MALETDVKELARQTQVLQDMEAIKQLLTLPGRLAGELVMLDLLSFRSTKVRASRRAGFTPIATLLPYRCVQAALYGHVLRARKHQNNIVAPSNIRQGQGAD